MGTRRGRMLAAGWLGVWLAATAAAGAAPPSPEQLRAWLRDLDSEHFAAREEATLRLAAAGESAIDTLAEGALSASPEAAWRASTILEKIALAGNDATLVRVSVALDRLSRQGKPGLATVVRELRVKQARLRHDLAAAKIRALGGQLSGEGSGEFAMIDGGGFFVAGAAPVLIEDLRLDFAGIVEIAGGEVPVLAEAAAEPAPPPIEPAAEPAGETAKEVKVATAPPEPAPPPDEPPPPAQADASVKGEIGEAFVADELVLEELEAEAGGSESLALGPQWRGGDAGLAALRDLPRIVSLSLNDAQITDAALAHIAALPKLTDLSISGNTGLTEAALRKYRERRPKTRVYAIGRGMLGVNAGREGPCVLSHVEPSAGAHQAGLAQGDEIVAVNGHKVSDFSELTIAVFKHAPGEKLRVDFKRGDERKTVEVTLKDREGK